MYPDDSENKKGLLAGGLRGGGFLSKSAGALASETILGSAGLFGKPKVEGLYFRGKNVVLDGYSFHSCRFDNCKLVVTSGNFDIVNCIIDASCTIEYGAQIAKVIQLFNSRFAKAYDYFAPPFVPIRNGDGTITITPGQ